ncbi:MAG TPA: hypothetical protein VHV55_07990 [Pirellulales bacterium]|jgi:hypothetical protein|nr:hypothetical protein [Pirellulales bacterium]
MSTGFDPYHAWLGLPPGSRPSNHYELLGLKLFASEPPIIADAADESLAKVKPLLAGAQGAMAKQLFDQLTVARAALLSPAAKRAYDAELRTRLGMPPAPEAKPQVPKTVRPAATTVLMPPSAQPTAPQPAAPTVTMSQVPVPTAVPQAAVPVAVAPMGQIPTATMPMAAMPVAQAPMAMPMTAQPMAQAMPVAAMPYGAPMMAQAVPMMQPGVAQAMPMQAYAPGMAMAQPAMPMGYGAPSAETGLEDIASPRRRRRRASGGQMVAIVGVLVVVGGVCAFGYLYREPLLAALEDKPQVVIHEGEDPTAKTSQPKPAHVAEESHKAKSQPANIMPARQPADEQVVMNVPQQNTVPPKRVRPKQPNPVGLKARPQVAAYSVSIKPRSPEEKAAVGRSLAATRSALAERNFPKVEEQLNLAMLEASSSESLAAIGRMRSLEDAYKEFWHAVRQSCKGLKSVDELEVDGKKMIVIDADTEHLSVRADGQSRDYMIEKLPSNMALSLAEQWLHPNDPSSKVVLGAFLAVDPKGDRQEARELWQEAVRQGSEVAKTLLAQDAD